MSNPKEVFLIPIDCVAFIAWNPELGKVLQQLRGTQSRRELSEKLTGICSEALLKKLEEGKAQSIDAKKLQNILKALNLELDALFLTVRLCYPLDTQSS